jgi:hypothetical protein
MRLAKLVALSALVAACGASSSSGPTTQGGASGSGGRAATGGTTSTTLGSGGTSATGGVVSSGGSSGSGTTAVGGASGGAAGTTTGGTATGGAGTGGATTTADGGPDTGRRDGSAGGSGGSTSDGGAGTGGATGTGGAGTGGARPDAGFDARPDAAADLFRDSSSDRGGGSDAVTSDGAPCTHAGHVTYTLARSANPTAAEQQAYDLIIPAMDKAVYYYNCYTDITKAVSVSYNASVQTADGNINGSIRFGGTQYMEYITAMHEIAHTVGIGTASNWRSFVAIPDGGTSGPWTGSSATAELRAITGKATDTLTADTQHFWPYGLNYTSEVKSEADVIDHCRIVVALRKDLGM